MIHRYQETGRFRLPARGHVGILVLGLALAGCAVSTPAPLEQPPHPDQMDPRPGLLSGADGEFVFYRSPAKNGKQTQTAE